MRRLTVKARARQLRQQRSVVRGWWKAHLAELRSTHQKEKKARDQRRKPYRPASRYFAPKVITIDDPLHRRELLVFLEQLRNHYRCKRDLTALIDFTRTTHLVCSGTLLLYAELNRLIAYSSNTVKLRCTESPSNRASQVLKQVGLYRLCSNKCNVTTNRDDVVHWKVVQGKLVDNSLYAPTIEGYQDRLGPEMIDELLGGLGEATTNAIHHAYDDLRQDGLRYRSEKEWWMFSQIKDGNVSVAICDLGIGIPASLPLKRPNIMEKLFLRKETPSDADCIREAIVEGRTSTSLDGRGYGLGNIVNVVEGVEDGMVIVYSNRGRYDSRDDSPFPYNYADSILGTMIYWSVPIRKPQLRSAL